ncbi:pentatricopeptide repeat protein [Aspergillus candidus]|uniref:MFS general substrate transporter n=1 Tax=Aspergillus candidus TaxID=41067 RepID=A0A2I2EXT8_ASPCN|nr:hypothetical protein BDW47DRAFT_121421 [Aspergillus candidus]PLB33206.1 hypothetical protein BDW47DRAFT_121421 [Aspergillus candidus]
MDNQAPLTAEVDALDQSQIPSSSSPVDPKLVHEQTPLLPRDDGSDPAGGGLGTAARDPRPWWKRPSIHWLMPLLLLYMLGVGGTAVPKINLMISLVCRDYLAEREAQNPGFTYLPVVPGGENRQCQIPEVQSQVAQFQLYFNLLGGILSALVSPLLGRLSDRHGRVRILAFSVLTTVLGEAIIVLMAAQAETVPLNVLLLSALFDGLGGSFTAAIALTSSYISDCTATDGRSVAFGYMYGTFFGGIAGGPLLVALLLKKTGNILDVFYTALALVSFVLVALCLVVPESLTAAQRESALAKHHATLARKGQLARSKVLTMVRHLHPRKLVAPLAILSPVVGRPSLLFPGRRGASPALRRNILLLAAIDTVAFGVAMGASAVIVIYAEYLFGWGTVEASLYMFIVCSVRVLNLLVVHPFAARFCRARADDPSREVSGSDGFDLAVIRLSLLFDALGYAGFALSRSGSVLIFAGVVTALGGLGVPVLQSSLTKHVPRDHIGQILGAKGLLHALARIVAPTLCNLIYSWSVGSCPQMVFILHPPAHPPAVPSRNALRVLRRLALAGSTVGSFCTVAAITYDMHRRVRVAERIVENKRELQTSAPRYDATSAARRLSRMMDAAEAGEFMGIESLKRKDRELEAATRLRPPAGDAAADRDNLVNVELEQTDLELARAEKVLGTADLDQAVVPPEQGRAADNLARAQRALGQAAGATVESEGVADPVVDKGLGKEGGEEEEGDGKRAEPNNLAARMQDLLERDRPIDAAQLFLEEHPASLDGISSERRERALEAFYANCKDDNVFIARSIFERIEAVDRVTANMWRVLMFALAKKGCIESTATVYTRYMHRFLLPPDMVDIVLRTLLESHRLTTAKWVLLRNLHVDRNCGLCGAYLTGLWRKTRSIELLNGQLKKLMTVLPRFGKRVTDKLFNPVLKAYIEFGRQADAEALVQEMTQTYELPLRCRTQGLLVYGRALACDWEGVDRGLDEMATRGLTAERRDFLPIFDRVFLEYWVPHSGREIWDFLVRYIDKLDIVPDRVLYRHILEALVEKGDQEMVAEFTRMGRERGWKVHINEEQFLEMLRSRRLSLEGSPVGFWQMLQAARVQYGQAATSQWVLGYDQRSFPLAQVNAMPGTKEPLPWYRRSLAERTPQRPVSQYQKLHKQMAHYMHVGKMEEALRCFAIAKKARFQVKQLHVELAVVATLLEHGLAAARALIEAEWPAIQPLLRFFPQFFRQLEQLAGVRWCILTALSRGSAVNRDLVVEVQRILGVLRRTRLAGPLTPKETAQRTEQLEYLTWIADLLASKSEGDPTVWSSQSVPGVKRAFRQHLKRPLNERRLYKDKDIQRTVERWDEEYELEAVLGRIETDPQVIQARWNQQACVRGGA